MFHMHVRRQAADTNLATILLTHAHTHHRASQLMHIFHFFIQTSIIRLMKENAPEWWLIVLGLIGAAVNGAIFPAFSVFFGGALKAFSLPPSLILPNIHIWAGLLLIIAVVSAVSNFLKVQGVRCKVQVIIC